MTTPNVTSKLRFAVFGHPIAQSISPAMHKAVFRALGLPHTYEAVDIDDLEHLQQVVDSVRQGTFAGANVTVPYKRAVLDLVERVDPSAHHVGAANTLVRSRGRVVATTPMPPALPTNCAPSTRSGGQRPSSARAGEPGRPSRRAWRSAPTSSR